MDESHELPPGFIERLMEAVKQKKDMEESEKQSFREELEEEAIGDRYESYQPK